SHDIRIVGSSTQELLLDCESPLLYINRAQHAPVTLEHYGEIFSAEEERAPRKRPATDFLEQACEQLRETCELQNSYEHLFLTLYFDQLKQALGIRRKRPLERISTGAMLSRFLLPLPQAHLYLTDFSSMVGSECLQRCVKVDFAFWTGRSFWVVLIDEPGHVKDRFQEEKLLRFWAVEIVRLSEEDLCGSGCTDFLRRICQFPQLAGCF